MSEQKLMVKQVILVGRHSSQLPPEIHVVEKENVMFSTGRAKVEVNSFALHSEVTVTVDPVSEFVFSHIEWLPPAATPSA